LKSKITSIALATVIIFDEKQAKRNDLLRHYRSNLVLSIKNLLKESSLKEVLNHLSIIINSRYKLLLEHRYR